MGSPWPAALGPAVRDLASELRAYVAPIPQASVGVGAGVFTTVGTPRRWLWPVLAAIGGGALFPVWAQDVPFTVRNTPVPGAQAVRAERRIRVDGRELIMRDEIVRTRSGVVDRIGDPVRLEAAFAARVEQGALRLDSRGVRLRVRGLTLPLGPLAPRIALVERFDRSEGRQHVSLRVDAPVIGRLYEYAGSFTYRIEEAT